MDNILRLTNVVKSFDEQDVVKGISIDIKRGEFLTLLGPSGCGKTTTLRMIAGFENPTSGSILLEEEHIENKQPYELNINTVFQNYALFPHMNVYNNIAYGLKIKKVKKADIKKRVQEILELIQLNGYDKRMPEQLSGGQKQRVAIGRALINNPKVLLLDEPLGALDLKLRKQMQLELKRLQKKLGITFIYVTHDQEEALNMSDRIVVMSDGVIEQIGTPQDIYERPKTRFVAEFIGESNLFDATVEHVYDGEVILSTSSGSMVAKNKESNKSDKVCVLIRPERTKYSKDRVKNFNLKATIKEHVYLGAGVKTSLVLSNGKEVIVNDYHHVNTPPPINTEVWIFWNPVDAVIIDFESEVVKSGEEVMIS
ncbi:ABC transporter ATP-binding protein [Clostridium sp. DJ247]|uniref:ABC transporter ATP-binding protein n=1 Tax=Clostridium sp. DJ247 TaxID=2726188 RepID=UPI00162AC4D5|nr:ABC transporter ATP-binding protein [Clostridium sp. DJ247]MBC2580417.1 ABC transporter ATP-binding protein [Clostridium sp. DJ247]